MAIWERGERSIHVGFSHEDGLLAVEVVQIAVEEYNRVTVNSEDYQASSAIKFYQDRIKLYEEQIMPRSAEAVQQYLESHPEIRRNVQENGPIDAQYMLLQQQANRDREQYQIYQQKLDDVNLQSAAARENHEIAFRFIDAPQFEPGGGRVSRRKLLMYALAGTGLSTGYIVCFLLLATELDSTVRHPGDISRRLRIPVLEIIPDYEEPRTPRGKLLPSQSFKRRRTAQLA